MEKLFNYIAVLQFGNERKYYSLRNSKLLTSESDIISLFVSENEFNEDDADNCIGAARLTESQYKAVMGKR